MSDCRRFGRPSDIPTGVSVCERATVSQSDSRTAADATHASIGRFHSLVLPKSEVVLPKREVSGADASVCRQHRAFRACAMFEVNLVLVPARTSCQHCLGETLMSWKTPKIVE